ncbi:MAG: MATE family efflux transporter [Blautia sp.]|nr:MATE family efflux transporter [Blautia sp.]
MNPKERAQYKRLVLTPINKLIPRLALPAVFSMLITMIYNLVDAYFVGRLGTSASASIGILVSVQSVFQALGFMFGQGSGSNISRHLGMGDQKAASRIASLGFFSTLLISLVPAILGLIFITPLMRFLGSTETILPYSIHYGFYILISGPALAVSCVLNNILRYEGRAFYSMFGLVTGGVLNMIGDPILMFGFHMGIDGAGLSTALSQYISLGVLLYMVLSGKTISRVSLRELAWNRTYFTAILKNGFPSLIRQVLNSIATATLNICANPYGDAAIAAMAIVSRVVMFLASTMMGIGQGFQPVSSYNYGAKKYRRIRQAFFFTWRSGELVLGVLAVLCMLVPGPVIRIFRDDPDVVRIGALALRLQCIAIIVQPLGVMTNMLFQSIGRSRQASFTATLRSGVYYIPALLILPRFFGLVGIQSAQTVADILTALTCIPFTVRFFREIPEEDQTTEVDLAYQKAVASEAKNKYAQES